MQVKRLLTIAGVIFLNLVMVAVVLETVDVRESPISRALVADELFDFGDAPADRYSTLQTDDGARHVPGERWLGDPSDSPDLEADGQPHPAALGDDQDGNDDEDGVLFLSPLSPGTIGSVEVTASFTGWLNAWIDFYSNDQWADAVDQIFTDEQLQPGPNTLTFSVPQDAVPGPTFSRWRFSSVAGLGYETGFNEPAPDGEVEDHWVEIVGVPPVDLWEKWIEGQPWDPEVTFTVQTSDTIQVVDVIRTDPEKPFLLTENWDPEHLELLEWAVEPLIPAEPLAGDGFFEWDVPPDHPDVLVLTKIFHVKPCTWEGTVLTEMLEGLEVQDPLRPVAFEKMQPVLGIGAQYEPEVLSGEPAWFTLVYSNNGGYENNVSIRNDFPVDAPYLSSSPVADRWDQAGGRWAEWDLADLAMGDEGSIDVEVGIVPGLMPSTTLNITDYIRNHLGQDVSSVEIVLHVSGASEPLFDLGDAPDSSNHTGVQMTTYAGPFSPGIPGHFPTVFDPATGLPQGPRHAQPRLGKWLGPTVSLEYDADLMPDQDGVTNLVPPADVPDLDAFDDGVTQPVTLTDCVPTYFTYTLEITPGAPALNHYVNVWFDWNRDGDWADIMTCDTSGDAPEWAVQDQLIPPFPPGTYVFATPTFLPYNKVPAEPIWMRISIAEQPAPSPPDGSPPDGRGPANGYAYGETEDYYLPGVELPPGEWIKLIEGQPWSPDFAYTVETSDTIEVVDIIHTLPEAPFTLSEHWDPAHLALLDHAIDPPLPFLPVTDEGIFILDVPADHPEVITVTKWFHVEPCTWEGTVLEERLEGLNVPDPVRPVFFPKALPRLGIDALYEPEVIAGASAQFTLLYSNTGGFESAARIRNGFPDAAPYSGSVPPADRVDPSGLWAEWDLGSLATTNGGSIDVLVDIAPGLQPSSTVVITDAIFNHAGELEDEVTIRYHVAEPRGWLDGFVMDSETGDLLPPCTQPWVGIEPGPIVVAADLATGYYGPVELVGGTYTVTASAPGYSIESATVDILHQVTTTQDFNLWRPVIVVTPTDFISVTAYVSQPVQYQLAIGNHGHLQMDWEIVEGAQGIDLPWVWEDPISGTIPPLSEALVDVTFHCAEPGDQPGTLVILHDDPCQDPATVPILLHCRPPRWEKWIDGLPWGPDIGYTVETSDTVVVMDVITSSTESAFTLLEGWNPAELVLRDWAVNPPLPDPVITGESFVLEVLPGHPEVITVTKWFHIEPCAWESTILEEELIGLPVQDPLRLVQFDKMLPVLGLGAQYEPGIFTGEPAPFTLVYSNTGGFENAATIRNEFPAEAPYSSSVPPADRQDPEGRWVEWDLYNLSGGTLDNIDVVVDITPGLYPSTTILITDYLYDHTGALADEVFIEYHVEPPPGVWDKFIEDQPWLPDLTFTVETSDTVEVVDVIRTSPHAPFALAERWNPAELVLRDWAIDPPIAVDPAIDDSSFILDVPGGHPEVITITKWFHVEPCTWRETTLDEELLGVDVPIPNRPVTFVKRPPELWIDAQYNSEVTAGDLAVFTLVYSNTGGFENDVMIRNTFPPEAPYITSVPPADRSDAGGTWAEWDIPGLPGGSPESIEVIVGIEAGLQPSTTIEIWDYIFDHTGEQVDEVMIQLHIQDAPPGVWDKLIEGQPWVEGITFTVETSDTVEVVDVVRTTPEAPFVLFEEWVPGELRLVEYTFDPPLPEPPAIDEGVFIWEVGPGHPEVITLTKKFHVEPCTWRRTTLAEALQGLDVVNPVRSVIFEKVPPDLRIDSDYNAQVQAGTVATFTLVYSNAGGFDNDVAIRNLFPPEALFLDADPQPAWQAPDGSEAKWEVGNLGNGAGGSIDVTVAIKSGLIPSNTIRIVDYIHNHAGEEMDQTTITYHVDETPPQPDDVDIYVKDNLLDDGSVPSTPPWWAGPDIWVRTDGDCSQTAHQNPLAGATNTICVRVRNRMATAVSNITVDLYWGSAALGLIWPGSYSIAGSAHIGSLAGGDTTVVAVPWNTPNISGHFCLLARADAPADPVGSGFDTVAPQDHVPNNNNLSMRNVNIVDYPEGECGLSTSETDTDVVYLDVVNPTNHVATVDVVFDSPDFPLDSGEIIVEPGVLWDRWSSLTSFDQADHTLIPTAFPASMGGISMDPYETAHVTLTLTAEIDVRFSLQVSELVDGILVGGVEYMRVLPHCIYNPSIIRNYSPPAPAWLPIPREVFDRDE